MNYVEILLKLKKSKKILFTVFLIFLISGHLMEKLYSKNYEFKFDIFFPTGGIGVFNQKKEIYSNFQSSILIELVKKNYTIKKKSNLKNAYSISTTVTGNNSEVFIKKKKEIIDIFQLQKNNLIRLISNNYDIANITITELIEEKVDGNLIKPMDANLINSIRAIRLELMWIKLEKEFAYKNITEFNNIKLPEKLIRKNRINYYSLMIVMFVAFIALYTSYITIIYDFKKKVKRIKK